MIEQFYSKTLELARKVNNVKEIENIKDMFKKAKQYYERLIVNRSYELSDDEEFTIEPFVEKKEERKNLTKKIDLSSPKQVISKQEANVYNKLCLEQHIQINKLLRE